MNAYSLPSSGVGIGVVGNIAKRNQAPRAGTFGLSLLADPLDARIFAALADGPLDLPELRWAVGTPPATTLRSHLRELARFGLLTRTMNPGFAKSVSHQLTRSGQGLLGVASALSDWLAASPGGPIDLATPQGQTRIKALAEGWGTSALRALASRPLSLTEVDRVIARINYPALERRLKMMRDVGQLAAGQDGTITRYRMTRWGREAAAPILASIDWEGREAIGRVEPLGRTDVEGIFALVLPLLNIQWRHRGTCRLAIDRVGPDAAEQAGVVVCVDTGARPIWRSDRGLTAPSWACGPLTAWIGALGLGPEAPMALGGDRPLPEALIEGLRYVFAPATCTRYPVDGDSEAQSQLIAGRTGVDSIFT
jgi:DNA-binding HxlR family transcriptional regulator